MNKLTKYFPCATLLFAIAALPVSASNDKANKPKVKMVHSHHSEEGGVVAMSGDTHVEFKKDGEEVAIFFSGKNRDPLAAELFNVEVFLVSIDAKKQALSFVKDSKVANKVSVTLPKNIESEASLWVISPLKEKMKAHVSVSSPTKMKISKIPEAKGDDSHGDHH